MINYDVLIRELEAFPNIVNVESLYETYPLLSGNFFHPLSSIRGEEDV